MTRDTVVDEVPVDNGELGATCVDESADLAANDVEVSSFQCLSLPHTECILVGAVIHVHKPLE